MIAVLGLMLGVFMFARAVYGKVQWGGFWRISVAFALAPGSRATGAVFHIGDVGRLDFPAGFGRLGHQGLTGPSLAAPTLDGHAGA